MTASKHKGVSVKTELYRKKQVIVREGAPGDCMFYIRWGKACAYSGYGTSNEKLLANLNTGDYFGEMSLLEHEGATNEQYDMPERRGHLQGGRVRLHHVRGGFGLRRHLQKL